MWQGEVMHEVTPDRAVELIEFMYDEAAAVLELHGVDAFDDEGDLPEEIDAENAAADHFEFLGLANEALLDGSSLIATLGSDDPALARLYAHRLVSVAAFSVAAAVISGSVDPETALTTTAAVMGSPDTGTAFGDQSLLSMHLTVSRYLARVFLTIRSLLLSGHTENARLALEAQENAEDWPADPGAALLFVSGAALEAAGRLWAGELDESMLYWYPTSLVREPINLTEDDEPDEEPRETD